MHFTPSGSETPCLKRYAENSSGVEDLALEARRLRYLGTDEKVRVRSKVRRTSTHRILAMRHGIDAYRRRSDSEPAMPDLCRLIYRPWLYAGTKVGAKLDRS